MSWFEDKKKPGFLMKFCYNVMKAGKIPKHVAFIMDGNRRFAKRIQVEKSVGHTKGFDKLTEVLQWCFELDIKEVTVYAFSVENFKRSKDEVNALMKLAKEKFDRLYEERELLMNHKVRVQLLGDLTLIPEEARRSIARIIQLTQNNDRHTLNVAMAYTSRIEMTESIKEVATAVQNGRLLENDVDDSLLRKCFYSSTSYDVDLLIRTSGEIRLSDFMLYQSSYAVLVFLKCLWPEMSIWNFFYAIIQYQLGYTYTDEAKHESRKNNISSADTRLDAWTDRNNKNRFSGEGLTRQQRQANFLYDLETRRRQYITDCLD